MGSSSKNYRQDSEELSSSKNRKEPEGLKRPRSEIESSEVYSEKDRDSSRHRHHYKRSRRSDSRTRSMSPYERRHKHEHKRHKDRHNERETRREEDVVSYERKQRDRECERYRQLRERDYKERATMRERERKQRQDKERHHNWDHQREQYRIRELDRQREQYRYRDQYCERKPYRDCERNQYRFYERDQVREREFNHNTERYQRQHSVRECDWDFQREQHRDYEREQYRDYEQDCERKHYRNYERELHRESEQNHETERFKRQHLESPTKKTVRSTIRKLERPLSPISKNEHRPRLDLKPLDALVKTNMMANKKVNSHSYGYDVYEEQNDKLDSPIEQEEIEKPKYFAIGENDEEKREQERKLLEIKSKLTEKRLDTLEKIKVKLATKTFPKVQLAEFKQPKNQTKQIRKKSELNDSLVFPEEDSREEQPKIGEENYIPKIISKVRKLKQKDSLIKMALPVTQIETEIKEGLKKEDELTESTKVCHMTLDLQQQITAEFCRNLDDIPANKSNDEKIHETDEEVSTDTTKSANQEEAVLDKEPNVEDGVKIVQEIPGKQPIKASVKLEYTDNYGYILNAKEAQRYISHKFHTAGPRQTKIEKRLKKIETDFQLIKTMSSTKALTMLQQKQKETKQPYVVLSQG